MDQGGPKSRFLGLSPDPCLDTCYANSFRGKVRMGASRLSVSDSQSVYLCLLSTSMGTSPSIPGEFKRIFSR
jgi:hypothetical protein